MHTREHKIDRKGWDPGPWDGEPDRVDFKTAAGLPDGVRLSEREIIAIGVKAWIVAALGAKP